MSDIPRSSSLKVSTFKVISAYDLTLLISATMLDSEVLSEAPDMDEFEVELPSVLQCASRVCSSNIVPYPVSSFCAQVAENIFSAGPRLIPFCLS